MDQASSGSNNGDNDDLHQIPIHKNDGAALHAAVTKWRAAVDSRQHGFFLARKDTSPRQTGSCDPEAQVIEGQWIIAPLSAFENGFFDGCEQGSSYVCFADPSNYGNGPGWMLRNLLILVRYRWKLQEVQILRYMEGHSRQDHCRSVVLRLKSESSCPPESMDSIEMPKVTGWERNNQQKLAGRIVDLKENLDPLRYEDS